MDSNLFVALIGGTFTLLTAVSVEWQRRQHNAVREVRAQVKNSHSTNLRDDIDRVLRALERQEGALGGIRTDMRVEREERLTLERRVDRFERSRR